MKPLTDIDKVLKRFPALKTLFIPVRPFSGYQPFPATPKNPHARVIFKIDGKEPIFYPTWPDVPEVLNEYEKMTRGFEGVIFIAGFGLGYLVEACLRNPRGHSKVAVWEPHPENFRYACYARDLTELLLNPALTLIVGDFEEIRKFFENQFRESIEEVFLLCDNELAAVYPELKEVADKKLVPLVDNYRSNRTTLMAFKQHFSVNMLKAIPALTRSHSVKHLKNLAAGFPAIICGSGPSLRRHYETLANFNMNQTGIILCADSALKPLLDHNVHPDFVCSVDPQPWTFSKYQGVDIPHSTSLVYHPGTASCISSGFQGHKFFCGTVMPPMDRMKHIFGDTSEVGSQIQCQTHFATDLAYHMGCDPIILVGMDLCYYGEDLYADTEGYVSGRPADAMDMMKEKAQPVKDQFGNDVQAPMTFIFYVRGFSTRAETMNLINCGEQGVDIPGIPNRIFRDVYGELPDGKWICLPRLLENIPEPAYDIPELLRILTGYRRDLQAHYLLAKNIVPLVRRGLSMKERHLVSKWTNKARRRLDCLHAIVLLAASGMVQPPILKQTRYDFLSDSIQAAVEQSYCSVYYEWMLSATQTVLPILEEIIADLRTQNLSQMPTLADADRRLPE